MTDSGHFLDDQRLVLSDLLNRVLDKGVVISGAIVIGIADIDLVRVDLDVVLSAAESIEQRRLRRVERLKSGALRGAP